MDIAKCWDFRGDEQPPYPTIALTVSSGDRSVTVNPKVDTGFNGWLAIDSRLVKKLRLAPAGTVLVETAAGTREVPIYPVDLSQSDLGILCATVAIGAERTLAGRMILQDRKWMLDCKEGKFCMIRESESGPRNIKSRI